MKYLLFDTVAVYVFCGLVGWAMLSVSKYFFNEQSPHEIQQHVFEQQGVNVICYSSIAGLSCVTGRAE